MKAEPKRRLSADLEIKSLRTNRFYIMIMALLLVAALIWVVTSVMEAGDESALTATAIKYAVPLNPSLDVAVFSTVESKRLLTEAELETFVINRLIKSRSGSYIVIPADTPKAEVERLTTGTVTPPSATPRPLTPKLPSATSSSTIRQ